MEPLWLTYEDIHRTVQGLAAQIQASGFDPEALVAIGSGGFIPARILRTFVNRPIWAVGIGYYDDHDQPTDRPQTLQWLDAVERQLAGRRILLVDEVDDSRATLAYCLEELLRHGPAAVAVAVLHNKRKTKRAELPPGIQHYFCGLEIEDRWIKYPWDARDLDFQYDQAQVNRAAANR